MYIILPYIRDQAVRKLTNPSLMKCLKSLWEMETPRMPDQSVQAYGPFIFQNSLGISGETQAVPRRNLIPKTRSLHSADHALSVDLQRRPVGQPAGLRWTHLRVGRVGAPRALSQAGRGGCSLAHPPCVCRLGCQPRHITRSFASVSSDSRALEKWKWSYPSEKARTLVPDLQGQGKQWPLQ